MWRLIWLIFFLTTIAYILCTNLFLVRKPEIFFPLQCRKTSGEIIKKKTTNKAFHVSISKWKWREAKIQCFQMRREFQCMTYLNLRKTWRWTHLFVLSFNTFIESFLLLAIMLWMTLKWDIIELCPCKRSAVAVCVTWKWNIFRDSSLGLILVDIKKLLLILYNSP